MKSTTWRTLGLSAVLLAAGCYSIEQKFELKSDGSGTYTNTMWAPVGEDEMSGATMLESMADSMKEAGDDVTFKTEKDSVWLVQTKKFSSVDEISSDSIAFSVEEEDGNQTFTATLDLGGGDDMGMFEGFVYRIVVEAPGKITDSDGKVKVSGSSATWEMPLADLMGAGEQGFSVTYKAGGGGLAGPGGGGPLVWIVGLLCCLVLICVIILVIVMIVRKGKKKTE